MDSSGGGRLPGMRECGGWADGGSWWSGQRRLFFVSNSRGRDQRVRGRGSSLFSFFFHISCYTSLFSLFLSFSIKKTLLFFSSSLSFLSQKLSVSLSQSLFFFSFLFCFGFPSVAAGGSCCWRRCW